MSAFAHSVSVEVCSGLEMLQCFRTSLAIPLVDAMVVSHRALGSMVRQTASNTFRRRRLDNEGYVCLILPCPARMPGLGSVPSSSIFSCLGRFPPPLSNYDARSGFCTILLHLLLSWVISLLPCPAMMPGRGSVPSSSIFSCLGHLLPPLSSYDARSGFCTILLHLLLSWASPSSLVQL